MGLSIVFNLIILGSTAAFNALMSLQLVALMATYMISISCVLWRRIKYPETLPPCRWSLGRWGVAINAVSILYSLFAFFFCFWPMATPVDLESMNWSPVMFVGVMVISMVLFVFRGRHVYDGPVVTTEGYHKV
jgi:choline transport protein